MVATTQCVGRRWLPPNTSSPRAPPKSPLSPARATAQPRHETRASQNRVRGAGRGIRYPARYPASHRTPQAPAPSPRKRPHPSTAPAQTEREKRTSQSRARGAGRGKTGGVVRAPLKVPPTTEPHGDAPSPASAQWPMQNSPVTRAHTLRDLRLPWEGSVELPRHLTSHLRVVDTLVEVGYAHNHRVHQLKTRLTNTIVGLHRILISPWAKLTLTVILRCIFAATEERKSSHRLSSTSVLT